MYATIRKSEPMEEVTLPEATPIEEQFGTHGAHSSPGAQPNHG
jgi:hypothetical protein